jgi:plasmid replication initiation protein
MPDTPNLNVHPTLSLSLDEEQADRDPLQGKDEMNLAEFPFAVLTRSVPPGQKTIEIVQEGRTASGKPLKQEWTVTGSDAFGLPTASDEEVYIALMKFLRDSGFRERTVRFRIADLLRIMNSSAGKRDYDRVGAALDRLTGVMIRSRNAFWDFEQKRHLTEAFHLLESYKLNTGSGNRSYSEVTFSEFLFASIRAGYVKNLDIGFYFQLSSPLAKRLYRLLDKHRYRGSVYEVELHRFASKLPLNDPYLSQLKRRLNPVFEELIQQDYLRAATYRVGSEGKIILRIEFALSQKQERELEEALSLLTAPDAPEPEPIGKEPSLHEALLQAGVSAIAAHQLEADFPVEKIRQQLTYLPYVQGVRNPGGYLRRAIEGEFAPPPEWEAARSPKKRLKPEGMIKLPSLPIEAPLRPSEEAVEAYMNQLQTENSQEWEKLVLEAQSQLAPPIRNRPQSQAYQAGLRVRIKELIRTLKPEFAVGHGSAVSGESAPEGLKQET